MSQRRSKKPRVTPPHERQDWSALGKLPLRTIAGHLNSIDHVRFRSACSSWRTSSAKRPKTPFLITTGYKEAFSFYDHVREENIPLPSDVNTYISYLKSLGTVYIGIGCSFGWIALAMENQFEISTITLINPFTFARVELSQLTGLRLFGGRVLLSGSPANLQQRPMVVYHSVYPRHLKFQQIGDKQWKTIQHPSSLAEVIACNGRFYGFTSNELYSIDLQANNGNGAVVQLVLDLPDIFSGAPPPRWKFLADFSGDLVVMCSHNERELFLKVDLENLRLVLMPNMAHCLLFQCQSGSSFYIPGDHRFLKFNHDSHHIVNTGSPNHVIIIYAHHWKHPDCKIRSKAVPLGWITPDLNKS
ncbi:hypothetical protein J5N97_016513 [Dioscorea zingiberensis]|uniref:KIB1-4 beta-propeller domain-containing protein n=1 Tax=Dioscorea zingiberensis TaxID=325984 RepID=A0A9D5CJI6_9LILI|nr:hypothetical protein J5N97_016513 [Dioscorea zingiberensis]